MVAALMRYGLLSSIGMLFVVANVSGDYATRKSRPWSFSSKSKHFELVLCFFFFTGQLCILQTGNMEKKNTLFTDKHSQRFARSILICIFFFLVCFEDGATLQQKIKTQRAKRKRNARKQDRTNRETISNFNCTT